MPRTARPEEDFQRMLEGSGASPELEPLAKLATALGSGARGGARPEFKAALRAHLLSQAAAEEDVFAVALNHPSARAAEEVKPLVMVAAALRPATLPVPSPAFRFQLRNRLLAEAATHDSATARARARIAALNARMRRSLRAVAATGLAASLLASGGMALAAAHDALPGTAFYGLKRFQESAQLSISSGTSRGFKYLGFARTRLGEVRGLADERAPNQTLYVNTLGDMNSETVQGTTIILDAVKGKKAPLALLDRVNSFAVQQAAGLSQLVGRLPAGAQPTARDSLTLVERVSAQITNALNGCAPCTQATPGVPSSPQGTTSGGVACSCSQPSTTQDSGGSSGDSGSGTATPPSGSTTPPSAGNPPPPNPGPIPTTIPGGGTLDDLLEGLGGSPLPSTQPLPGPTLTPLPSVQPTATLPVPLPSASLPATPSL